MTQPGSPEQSSFAVTGMTRPSVASVRAEVSEVAGVTSVAVDLARSAA